jgi:hypothetical protein
MTPIHTPTPWFALSGGYITTSVVADWASKEKYIGMAATEKDAQTICLAHNEAIGRAISSVNEKRSEAPVNGYEALERQNEAMREAITEILEKRIVKAVDGWPYDKLSNALALTQDRKAVRK